MVTRNDHEKQLGEVLDIRNFYMSASEMHKQFHNIVLARLQFLLTPNDGTLPRIKQLRVTQRGQVFFAPSEHSELVPLPLGTHTAQTLFPDPKWATTVQSTVSRNFGLFVHINSHPITVTFQLPDWIHMEPVITRDAEGNFALNVANDKVDFKKALEQVNLRSADFFFGGAQVQVKLRVIDPTRFLETLADYMVDRVFPPKTRDTVNRVKHGDDGESGSGGLAGFVRRIGKSVKEFLVGKESARASSSDLVNRVFRLSDLYERIRLEFLQAVQQAVQSLHATDLLENKDGTRKAVSSDIKQFMGDTLVAYGIEVLEVPAFEFLCPDLFAQQRSQGEIELRKRWLEDQKKRMDLNRQTTILAKEEERFDATLEFEDELTEIEREGIRSARKDANAADAQVRQLDMDATKQEHARAQLAENERLAIALGKEKALADNDVTGAKRARELSEYQRQLQITGEHERQKSNQDQADFLAVLEAVGRLPPTLQQAALNMYQARLAATRPELAAMLAASQNAAGLEQQLARERELAARHSQELSAAHTQGTQQAVQLLASIVQQAGNVLVAHAKPATPPAPPRTLPNSDPDRTEGGAQ